MSLTALRMEQEAAEIIPAIVESIAEIRGCAALTRQHGGHFVVLEKEIRDVIEKVLSPMHAEMATVKDVYFSKDVQSDGESNKVSYGGKLARVMLSNGKELVENKVISPGASSSSSVRVSGSSSASASVNLPASSAVNKSDKINTRRFDRSLDNGVANKIGHQGRVDKVVDEIAQIVDHLDDTESVVKEVKGLKYEDRSVINQCRAFRKYECICKKKGWDVNEEASDLRLHYLTMVLLESQAKKSSMTYLASVKAQLIKLGIV